MNFRSALIFAFAICSTAVWAKDEKSINDLRDALVALAPHTVDPHEAEVLSVTAHTTSRQLAHEYGVAGDPAVHNFLINVGAKKRGICADYTRDIGVRFLKIQDLQRMKQLWLFIGLDFQGSQSLIFN